MRVNNLLFYYLVFKMHTFSMDTLLCIFIDTEVRSFTPLENIWIMKRKYKQWWLTIQHNEQSPLSSNNWTQQKVNDIWRCKSRSWLWLRIGTNISLWSNPYISNLNSLERVTSITKFFGCMSSDGIAIEFSLLTYYDFDLVMTL